MQENEKTKIIGAIEFPKHLTYIYLSILVFILLSTIGMFFPIGLIVGAGFGLFFYLMMMSVLKDERDHYKKVIEQIITI